MYNVPPWERVCAAPKQTPPQSNLRPANLLYLLPIINLLSL